MNLPGDWHTGLNMAQSIYNVFYNRFLDQFQDLLHWQRINSDVSSCYYQATRLVTFVFDELIRFFAHKYMSQRVPTQAEREMNDADYISAVALGFQGYVSSLKTSRDPWIATWQTCGHELKKERCAIILSTFFSKDLFSIVCAVP